MKQVLLILTIFGILQLNLNAQRVVALHSSLGVEMFSGPDPYIDAYNAAQDGDTIYLPGGNFSNPASFDKSLTVIGAGYHPDSTVATTRSTISYSLVLYANASSSRFEGLEFLSTVTTSSNVSVNHLNFKRCKFNFSVGFSGSDQNCTSNTFKECIFLGNIILRNTLNSSIYNSIIEGTIDYSVNNFILNCIFLRNATSSTAPVLIRFNNNEILNNIFITSGTYVMSTSASYLSNGNILRNNLFVSATPNLGSAYDTSGNYFDVPQTEIFIDQSGNVFDFEHDYNLQSLETYKGNDDSQVGIYGGVFPFKDGGIPVNPHIQLKDIAPKTSNDGGLQIQIQVEAQDY